MFIPTEDYLQRISHALEHVIAPQIESDFARGQLLAAVFLLDQLTDRVDYKADLIRQEITWSSETIKSIVEALQERHAEVPAALMAFHEDLNRGASGQDLAFRNRCDDMLCSAIDAYYAHRDRFDPASAHGIEERILAHLSQIAFRDLGMLKPSTSEKLLRVSSHS
jgi:hypothetical protein